MTAHARLLLASVGLALGVGALAVAVGDQDDVAPPATSTTITTAVTRASTTITVAPTPSTAVATTTTAPPIPWPAVGGDGSARAVVTPNGVVLAVLATRAEEGFTALSPCGNEVTVVGTPLSGATVVLDPGHGGDEPGAVGPGGTAEKDVNLAVAREAQRLLEADGATVVLTRTGDYRITLASRGAIAQALQPVLFISIHHNAEPDEQRATPGSETYFQIGSAASKRASGLVYEELVQAFSAHRIDWASDRDAGAKYRPTATGGDYYGILKRTAGLAAVLSEAAFISNPAEEALLADPAFQQLEARALTRAAVRYVTTDDPGSGYVEPYPRTLPAGPGGGATGCIDPPLG
ncbi:MAG: N-acetylmuramoyl-L-alanine amidase [Acidimicrobiales bacterium]